MNKYKNDELLTPSQFAYATNKSLTNVYIMLRSGEIETAYRNKGSLKVKAVPKKELKKFLSNNGD